MFHLFRVESHVFVKAVKSSKQVKVNYLELQPIHFSKYL